MANDRTARINQAVDEILEHCSRYGAGVLQQCLDGLSRNPAWSADEIELVRAIITRRLGELDNSH